MFISDVPVCVCVLHTELADMVIAGGFWHGCDGEQGTAVSSQRFTQILLSVVDLRSTQSTQLLQMHLNKRGTKST